MVGRWSESATLKFVYFYKLHECLWNTKSEFYSVKDARNAAYADLVLQMRMPDFDVRAAKVKIKNLRAHYFTELKKVRYAAAMGERYEPTLYWYKEMDSFLRDTIGDLPSFQQPEVITADSIYDSSCIYESGFGDDEDSMEKPTPFLHISDTRSLAPPKKKNSSAARGSAPFNRRTSLPVPAGYRPGPASKKRKKAPQVTPTPEVNYADEFEAFGKSVSAQLRKLSLSRALRAQTKIQAILTEERINEIESKINTLPETATPPPPPDPQTGLPTVTPNVEPEVTVVPTTTPDIDSAGITATTTLSTKNLDSGIDSGIDTTSSSAASSIAGLPSPSTPTSMEGNPISMLSAMVGETPSISPPSVKKESSSSSLKALKEFRKTEPTRMVDPVPSSSDVIVKTECEIITLDEDDPFEGH